MKNNSLEILRQALLMHRRKIEVKTPVVWIEGDKVTFTPTRGAPRQGVIKFDFEHRPKMLLVQLRGDPYPVYVSENQVRKEGIMPDDEVTETPKPKRASTRKAAKPASKRAPASRTPRKATKAAKSTRATKKAPTARKTAPKSAKPGPKPLVRAADNPFRPGSNSWHYTEALKKGGKRSQIVRNLLKKIEVHPWNEESYADPISEVDKRLTMVVKTLEKKFGFSAERRGRGSESFIKVSPPSGERPAKRTSRQKNES